MKAPNLQADFREGEHPLGLVVWTLRVFLEGHVRVIDSEMFG